MKGFTTYLPRERHDLRWLEVSKTFRSACENPEDPEDRLPKKATRNGFTHCVCVACMHMYNYVHTHRDITNVQVPLCISHRCVWLVSVNWHNLPMKGMKVVKLMIGKAQEWWSLTNIFSMHVNTLWTIPAPIWWLGSDVFNPPRLLGRVWSP